MTNSTQPVQVGAAARPGTASRNTVGSSTQWKPSSQLVTHAVKTSTTTSTASRGTAAPSPTTDAADATSASISGNWRMSATTATESAAILRAVVSGDAASIATV